MDPLLFKIIIVSIIVLIPLLSNLLSKKFRSELFLNILAIANKTDLAGTNIGSIVIALLFLFSFIPFIWLWSIGHPVLSILVLIIPIFSLFFAANYIIEKTTLSKLKNVLNKNREDIIKYSFSQYETSRPNKDNVSFSNLNLFFIDVIVALTDSKNIYIRPTTIYTRQPIIKIPAESIQSIQIKTLRVTRDQVDEGTNTMMATRGGEGIGVPLNQISTELDKFLPLDKTLFKIKTEQNEYGILVHKKKFSHFKEILKF